MKVLLYYFCRISSGLFPAKALKLCGVANNSVLRLRSRRCDFIAAGFRRKQVVPSISAPNARGAGTFHATRSRVGENQGS